MKLLHTMFRVSDLEESLHFYCNVLGLIEVDRKESQTGRFTLVYLCCPDDLSISKQDRQCEIELTYNWDREIYEKPTRSFGHIALRVPNIYESCQKLVDHGVDILRPPRDGHMAFVKSPDGISIELLQEGEALSLQQPWETMKNQGTW